MVLDGEAVIWNRDRLDFEALQRRMVTSRAALPALVHELPAAFVAFDVLAVAGQDIRGVPFTGRRQLLEELARDWAAPLNLSPTTTDMEPGEDLAAGSARDRSGRSRVQRRSQPYEAARILVEAQAQGSLGRGLRGRHRAMAQPQAIIAGLPIERRTADRRPLHRPVHEGRA